MLNFNKKESKAMFEKAQIEIYKLDLISDVITASPEIGWEGIIPDEDE